MSTALQIATLIATLPLVLCFTGILLYTLRKTGRASKGVLLMTVLISRQAWVLLIGTICLPVVAAVLYLVVYVAELVVSSSVIAAQGRTLKHCHSREGASVYNQCNAHANLCQTRVQRRALRKSLMKLRKKGQKAERQAENTHRKCRIAFRLLQILRLPCYTPLMESMLRTCLWCVLLHGFAQGDVAATGACILWMLGLHGNTAAACRAFSMLVMLGLDARSFPPEGKVLLCAAVAVAPLFPPSKKTPTDYMRETRDFRALHKCDPVENPGTPGYALAMRIRKARAKGIFNVAELAELDSIIGHRPGNTSAATGQEDAGKRGAPACQESAASAAAPKTRKRSKIPEVSLREGLFFDPQQGAWCGMHALNNYCLNGRLVQQQDCRDAARLVARRLTDALAGDVESISNHLDPLTGWLSIDVINVLGQANLGLHVEAARVSWLDGLCHQQDGAALVNWNQQHWTVLQRDPSGDGWMHTNSIEGVEPRNGRRRRLSVEAVQEVLDDIRLHAGDVALHAITRTVGSEGRQYLEREAWRALAPAENDEASGDAGAGAEADSDTLSLVTLNVDGLGDYTDSPGARMNAILTDLLLVEPDVLVLQEMTAPMLTQLRRRLPHWKACRKSDVTEYYFNVTVMRLVKILACIPCVFPHNGAFKQLPGDFWGFWEMQIHAYGAFNQFPGGFWGAWEL